MALLEVHDLHAAYGAIKALKGISLSVEQGQVVSLIGANGAGKSTTLNVISGLLKPKQGQILFDGTDITGWRADKIAAQGLAQVPEGRQIIAPMTVIENLLLGAYRRRDNIDADLDAIFRRFPRLFERRHQKAGSLSGGEQQMLSVGRALMAKPSLLLLDEPSLGLAPLVVAAIGDIIKEINKAGLTVILVEQNARLALGLANRGYLLETGNLVMEGDAEALAKSETVQRVYLGAS